MVVSLAEVPLVWHDEAWPGLDLVPGHLALPGRVSSECHLPRVTGRLAGLPHSLCI